MQAEASTIASFSDEKRTDERTALAQRISMTANQLRASAEAIRLCLSALTTDSTYVYGPRRIPGPTVQDSNKDKNEITQEVSQQLDGVFLAMTDLKGINLKGASLQGARLQRVNLFAANLEGAYLWGAYVDGAAFSHRIKGAHLYGARLTNTDVAQLDLTDADLETQLYGARLEAANWWDANYDYPLVPEGQAKFNRPQIDKLFEKYPPPPATRRRGNLHSESGRYIAAALESLKDTGYTAHPTTV